MSYIGNNNNNNTVEKAAFRYYKILIHDGDN